MSNHGIRAHILMLASRDCGVAVAEVSGFTAEAASMTLYRLRKMGKVHAARISHRRVRYFVDEARAAAYEKANKRASSDVGPANHTGRMITMAGRHQRAWWPPDAPMVITENTKITRAAPLPQPTRTNTHSGWGGA